MGRVSVAWRWRVAFALAVVAISSLGVLCSSCGGRFDGDRATKLNSQLQASVALISPKGVPVLSPVLEAADGLVLGAGSRILPSNPAVAMGATGTRAEPDAILNELWSRGPAELRDRVHLLGAVHAVTLTLGNGVVIDGARDRTPVFDPVERLNWTVTYPSTIPSNVDLLVQPPETRSAAPGNYTTIRVGNGSVLNLSSGVYYTSTFQLESGSQVRLDQTAGPVIIYASSTLILRGSIAETSGAAPDLLIGYLGTNSVFVETKFSGAIIAPSATLVLRNVNQSHTGFFSAKRVELDAHATVGYRFPLPVITATNSDPATCKKMVPLRSDLTGAAQEAAYAADLARYCGVCTNPRDTDGDGTFDCLDECPYDAAKKLRGACGCGVADVDLDGDRVFSCVDICDGDPNNILPGDCGCVGKPGLKAAGTSCLDPACPNQASATCNGAGVCGNRSTCRPATDCVPVPAQGSVYWICGGAGGSTPTPKTWQAASQACSAKSLVLARVDTYSQNEFIRSLLSSYSLTSAWLGGNSRSAANAWRWAKAGSDNGDQFWSGGATGARVNGRFASWSLGRPGTQRCMAMQRSDGRWFDNDCAQARPYICELPPTIYTRIPTGLPIPVQARPHGTCVPENGGSAPLPASTATLKTQYDEVEDDIFTGAAANPPPLDTTCPANPAGAENCPLSDLRVSGCADDSDCKVFSAAHVCRVVKDLLNCVPTPSTPCRARAVCGVPNCPVDEFANRCNQIDICPGSGVTFNVPGPDAISNLTPAPVVTDQFFPGTKPSTTESASYSDPPAGQGKEHSWCQLTPQNTGKVQPATQPTLGKQGQSGAGTPLLIKFNPDITIEGNPDPLAFGESNLNLHAAASLGAHVTISGLLGPYDGDIFKATVGLKAERCRINTGETSFMVLGQDIVELSGFVPKIDTDHPSAGVAQTAGQACKASLGDFLLKAGRLKKAFRDAQQLLKQYNKAKIDGLKFASDFCQQVGIDRFTSLNFPFGGVCIQGESPEETINRFVDYYQGEVFGELFGIDRSAISLQSASGALRSKIAEKLGAQVNGSRVELPFADFKRSESQSIVNATFLIGPVPMTLEISAVASYGVRGTFGLDLPLPTDLSPARGDMQNPASPRPQDIAKVTAGVEPWAAAGLSLFVGAGFSVPGVSASAGVEGAVTIAKITAPLVAGVGVSVATTPDSRPVPDEIKSVASLIGDVPMFPFGRASYQFYLNYQYGAAITLTDVLSGTVSGRLKIKFFFFSRTWRKKIVEFKGWGLRFPLIADQGNTKVFTINNGSQTSGVDGVTPLGRSEPALPFVILSYLTPPPATSTPDSIFGSGGSGGGGTGGNGGGGGAGGNGQATVDLSQVEKFSYDELCCSKLSEQCSPSGRPACCPNFVCTNGTCQAKPPIACGQRDQNCGYNEELRAVVDCCDGLSCSKLGKCVPACINEGLTCTPGIPCCGILTCDAVTNTCEQPIR